MDIKKYEVFLNALEKGCFAKVCEELGYTQPAITSMMKSMEREIGFPLLKRSNKGIQLTHEGREVLPLIRELVKVNNLLNQRYDMLRGIETGHIRVGVFPTVASAWMPKIISRFEKKYPHIEIELLEENSIHRLEDWLTNGYIDIAFISRQPYHNYKWIHLKKDPYYAILPPEHPLTSFERLPAEEFREQPFLMCRSTDGPDEDITRYFAKQNVPIKTRFTSNQDYTIVYMVREGLGLALLPELIIKNLNKTTADDVNVRLMDPPFYRELGMALRQGEEKSPALSRFIDCVKSMSLELNSPFIYE